VIIGQCWQHLNARIIALAAVAGYRSTCACTDLTQLALLVS